MAVAWPHRGLLSTCYFGKRHKPTLRKKEIVTTPRKLKRATPRDPLVPAPMRDYVNRTVEGGVLDFDLFDYARDNKLPLLIEGPTGCGKTMAVQAYAAARGMRFQSISCNAGVDPSQLWGRVIPTNDGAFVWQDGIVTDMARNGGLLLFNEINFLPERISTALFPLFDGRRTITLLDHRGEVIEAHPDLMLVMDMNPGYLGTRPLNAAFRNRQTLQTSWGYDPEVEEHLIPHPTLREMITAIRVSDQYATPVSTNMGMEFVKHANALGMEFAIMNFANHFRTEERLPIQQTLATWQARLEDEIFPRSSRKTPPILTDGYQIVKEIR